MFLNRELSWLAFNQRVLALAESSQVPLLERVKFLSIVNRNLDEFFMKRVGSLKQALKNQPLWRSWDGLDAQRQLRLIRVEVLKLVRRQALAFNRKIKPDLARSGIVILSYKQLRKNQKQFVKKWFNEFCEPVLTPFVVDQAHPFPHISNLSTSLGVLFKHGDHTDDQEVKFARIKVPEVLPQWVELPSIHSKKRFFVSLLDILRNHILDLYPDSRILSVTAFRVTRSMEVDVDVEDAEDILEQVALKLHERKFAQIVRLELGPNPDPQVVDTLKEALDIQNDDIYVVPENWDLDYCTLDYFYKLSFDHLKYPPFVPQMPLFRVAKQESSSWDWFEKLKHQDILVHHPYESFNESVLDFVRSAAKDEQVLAIKITLYRTEEKALWSRLYWKL